MRKYLSLLLAGLLLLISTGVFASDGDPILEPGSTSITTVGTITTGTWQGTAIDSAYIATSFQPLDADLTYLAGFTPSANVKTLLNAANNAAIKAALAYYTSGDTIVGTFTGNASTATALAANGANCNAGYAPLGVDASGAVESCFAVQTALTYPVTGVAAPTAGYLTKWGVSGNAIVDGPKLGTLTDAKWCIYTTADGLKCTEDAPAGIGDVVGPVATTQYSIPYWAAAAKTLVDGVAPGAANALLYSNGTNWARLATSADITSFLGSADYSTMRTNLGLAIGTNVQAYNLNLASLAGLTFADVSIIQLTGAAGSSVLTSGGNNYFLGSNSDNTGLEFKTPANVLTQIGAQGLDSDLTYLAGFTPSANVKTILNAADNAAIKTALGYYTSGDAMTGSLSGNSSTASALAANGANCDAGSAPLGVDASGAVEGCFAVQASSAALASLAALTETNGGIPYGTADNAYAWLAAGTANYLLQGNGAAAPSWTNAPTVSAANMTNFPATLATLANPTFTGTVILPKTLEIQDTSADHQYVLAVSELTADRIVTLPLLTGADEFVFKDFIQTLTNKTLTSPVLTTPQINDTSLDHQYIFVASELTADRNVTLPLLTGADEFTFNAHTQTLTNKTLTSPKINEDVALTTTATKLNYLTSATGTTGTNSTNVVFSTAPTLVTPVLGAATATSINSSVVGWTQTTGTFTATPASTSTITMTTDLTSVIAVGSPLKYVIGGVTYYGQVTALAANLLTVAGAPLGGDVTALYYGGKDKLIEIVYTIPGYYEDADNTALITSDGAAILKWYKPAAYCVRYIVYSRIHDTHATHGKATVYIAASDVNSSAGGLTIAADATEYPTVVDINTTNYSIAYGEAIEIGATKGGTGDAQDLTVTMIFVME